MRANLYAIRFLILLTFILFSTSYTKAQIINTIAGTGTSGYVGDGTTATAAELSQPFGIKVDNSGNVYFADELNNRIRKISNTGIITTIAGGGSSGLDDGGLATDAQISEPVGVVFDAAGNMYFSDLGNSRVRKVNTLGVITTIAGTGASGYSGDGGPATAAVLNYPEGMAIDIVGNIYFTEEANQRIRKIDTSGIITTIAGSGATGLFSGSYSGDGGPATLATLNRPYGVYADRYSNVYIADGWNSRIRKIDASGNISTVAGGGSITGDNIPATAASLNVVIDVAADAAGNLFISEGNGCRILMVDTTGILRLIAGTGTCAYSGDGGIDTASDVSHPGGVTYSACGNIYFSDWGNNRVREVTKCTAIDSTTPTNITSKQANENLIEVYPNPNKGTFILNITSNITEQLTVEITNIVGQKVDEYTATTNTALDIKLEASQGIYFLNASSMHGNWNAKIVVQ